MAEEIVELNVEMLQANPLQARGVITPESLRELADSIKQQGILEPLIVAHTPAGYQIIAGERRWRAAKMAGLMTVPCLVKESSHRQMLEMALVENIQREDLNPLERALAFKRLREEFGLAVGEIAERIGKSGSFVSNSLRLLTLPDALKDALINGDVTEGHIRALAAIEEPSAQIEALKVILQTSGTVRMAEELAREYQERKRPEKKGEVGAPKTAEVRGLEQRWRAVLGAAKALITQSKRGASVTLRFRGPFEETTVKLRLLDSAFQKVTSESASGSKPNLPGGQ